MKQTRKININTKVLADSHIPALKRGDLIRTNFDDSPIDVHMDNGVVFVDDIRGDFSKNALGSIAKAILNQVN